MTRSDLEALIVADVMKRWPVTIPVFNRRGMACPGCTMAPFMTVAEAARSYDFKPDDLASDLLSAIAGPATA